MKIGVFGGCFNPFHLGHLSLIEEISSQTEMDKIIFIHRYPLMWKTIEK